MAEKADLVPEEEEKVELSHGEIPENLDDSGNVIKESEADDELEEAEEEDAPEEEEKPVSRRENLRIQALVEKLREKEAPEATPARRSTAGLDYAKELEADPDTVKTLTADRDAYGDARFNEGLERAKSIQFHTRLEIDAPRVESKYPQLDKNSKDFDPAIANALNSMYLGAVGFDQSTDTVKNPNIRYADYIESMMELVDAVATTKSVKSSKNIAKQAASTGLRPDGSSAKRMNLNKAPEDMTDEELKAVIAQAIPSK